MHDGPLADGVMDDSPLRKPVPAPVEPAEAPVAPAPADPDPVPAAEAPAETLIERVEHAVMDAIHEVTGS